MLLLRIFVFRSPYNVLFLQTNITFDWLFYKKMQYDAQQKNLVLIDIPSSF